MALGASPVSVVGMIFGEGNSVDRSGGWLLARSRRRRSGLIRNLLFEVKPLDPLVFGVEALMLAAFAMRACYLPARPATRVDPMVALRQE